MSSEQDGGMSGAGTAGPRTFRTASEKETEAAGEAFAARVSAGEVVLLFGDLGAGKTAFVRGLARGLGGEDGEVTSPTFTLVQEYPGRLTLYHADLYRLTPPEVEDLGLDELTETGVLAIEWADRWEDAPRESWRIAFRHEADTVRAITITPLRRVADRA